MGMNMELNYPPNCFRVCIDNKESDLQGRGYSPLLEGEIKFMEFRELILQMDALFDRTGYPQSFQQKRSFRKNAIPDAAYHGVPQTELTYQDMQSHSGRIATLDIMVESRRNTSWQGMLLSETGEKLEEFDGEWGLIESVQKYLEKDC